MHSYTVVVPAYNEADVIASTVSELALEFRKLNREAQIIVVDDGSEDATSDKAATAGATVIRNPINSGYGFSLKRGLAAAVHPHIVIIDADATYPIAELPKLAAEYEKGYDMVVAQRTGREYRRGLLKYPARLALTAICEFAVGKKIPDINSGFRIFRKSVAERFREDLCNGFSFTTTITLLSLLQGYFVRYLPIEYHPRVGASKVRHMRDTLRVLQIIVRAVLLYNPIKIFLLLAIVGILAGLAGLIVGGSQSRWAEAGIVAAIFLTGAMVIFSLGMVADILAMLRLHFMDDKDTPHGSS